MDGLVGVLSRYPNGTRFIMEWENGLKIKCVMDTIYETDNGLELDEEAYQEYYACAVKVESILEAPDHLEKDTEAGRMLEVSAHNEPVRISLENGTIIWE